MRLSNNGKQCEPTCGYQCHSSNTCILSTQRCDGNYDCPEQDDELNCNKKPMVTEGNADKKVQESDSNLVMIISACVSSLVVLVCIATVIVLMKRKRSRSDLRYVHNEDFIIILLFSS